MVFQMLEGCTTNNLESKKQSQDRLSRIVHGIRLYEENLRMFPPESVSRRGEPMHSWRTFIVPFLETNPFYNSYDLESSWESGRNKNLMVNETDLTRVREVFCGKTKDSTTMIVMILKKGGDEYPYRGVQARVNSDWMFRPAEVNGWIVLGQFEKTDIHWMEPRDYFLDDVLASAELKSRLRSLAIVSIKTKETEFIVESHGEIISRLEALSSE